ncbi:hypothetical protein GGTG_13257 [Gaeumannomyces tritici R3-111a-1]|uniref:Uncharacterized protein n=1 Tax=Gaeumannomyces tritici (strain R3-111a-1) TaxID=644352 RepID=J3PIC9_GAET3|nr:hypothetical protein GGTG_13257 [Gaeumannomyces tritici R3-111a-1]EJT69148.1 hypothetical protein GGTG_13257 [Gaeumannomyces tritici R3-111a-1]
MSELTWCTLLPSFDPDPLDLLYREAGPPALALFDSPRSSQTLHDQGIEQALNINYLGVRMWPGTLKSPRKIHLGAQGILAQILGSFHNWINCRVERFAWMNRSTG